MPKRLIAMKLFMKERLLILIILVISHKIAEFIEEVNHHATIASRHGSRLFSGNSHSFHGMNSCFQRIGVHSKECPNDSGGSTSHCSNFAHHGMSFMNISHSFAIRDEVYGSSYNYDTGKLLSQFLSLFLHLLGFLVTIHSLHAYLVRVQCLNLTGISLDDCRVTPEDNL